MSELEVVMDSRNPTNAELDDLAAQLARLISGRLLDSLEILLGRDEAIDALHRRVERQAQVLAAQLLGEDDLVAQRTGITLISALYPGDTAFDPPAHWWQTPLGRAVAWRVGHPGAEAVSNQAAGAMLGITRQGVHDLLNRGKLDRHPEGGVTTASIRARLGQRSS